MHPVSTVDICTVRKYIVASFPPSYDYTCKCSGFISFENKHSEWMILWIQSETLNVYHRTYCENIKQSFQIMVKVYIVYSHAICTCLDNCIILMLCPSWGLILLYRSIMEIVMHEKGRRQVSCLTNCKSMTESLLIHFTHTKQADINKSEHE